MVRSKVYDADGQDTDTEDYGRFDNDQEEDEESDDDEVATSENDGSSS